MPVLSNVLLKRDDFLTTPEIKDRIRSSSHYGSDGTAPQDAAALLFFRTSKQRTWLVATPHRLYCILDNLPKDRANVNWSLGKAELFANGQFTAHIAVRDKAERPRTGLLDLGPKRNWLLTKTLFGDQPVQEIQAFIERAMAGAP